MKRSFLLVALAALALLTVVSCGSSAGASGAGGGQQMTTKMSEMKFEPNTFTVNANQPVTISAQNVGSVVHDLTVKGMDKEVKVTVDPGKTGTLTFTPTKPGTYEVVCVQPGHEAAGMTGTLTVK